MEHEEYRYLFELEDSLWWFIGMRRITEVLFERFAPRDPNLRILDAGCGTGGMLMFLSRYGFVTGIDRFDDAIQFAKLRNGARLAQASIVELPFPDQTFDVVTEFEVIYHRSIQDDQQAFDELARILQPGGLLFYREPAYQWLLTKHDHAVHTRERYSQRKLERLLKRADFEPLYQGYANCFLFPVALTRRFFGNVLPSGQRSDVRALPTFLNDTLAWTLSQEAKIIRRGKLPFGLSQIGVARRSL
jgi:SAM-dependent methyltransferase